MLVFLVILNIFLSILNGVIGAEGNLFSMWVSGFAASTTFTIFLIWLSNRN